MPVFIILGGKSKKERLVVSFVMYVIAKKNPGLTKDSQLLQIFHTHVMTMLEPTLSYTTAAFCIPVMLNIKQMLIPLSGKWKQTTKQ